MHRLGISAHARILLKKIMDSLEGCNVPTTVECGNVNLNTKGLSAYEMSHVNKRGSFRARISYCRRTLYIFKKYMINWLILESLCKIC